MENGEKQRRNCKDSQGKMQAVEACEGKNRAGVWCGAASERMYIRGLLQRNMPEMRGGRTCFERSNSAQADCGGGTCFERSDSAQADCGGGTAGSHGVRELEGDTQPIDGDVEYVTEQADWENTESELEGLMPETGLTEREEKSSESEGTEPDESVEESEAMLMEIEGDIAPIDEPEE